ncbi:MAG: ANTAR domain-containing protein, partial [Clostridiales bacterium]|nr:ANTAR domain-containing protein [Clostridiales bacterium]
MKKVTERLENRVLIEKAKGRIMAENNMSEQEAYDYIRKLSLEKALSMRRVAEIIMVRSEEKKI